MKIIKSHLHTCVHESIKSEIIYFFICDGIIIDNKFIQESGDYGFLNTRNLNCLKDYYKSWQERYHYKDDIVLIDLNIPEDMVNSIYQLSNLNINLAIDIIKKHDKTEIL